jgi:hypothetical protein
MIDSLSDGGLDALHEIVTWNPAQRRDPRPALWLSRCPRLLGWLRDRVDDERARRSREARGHEAPAQVLELPALDDGELGRAVAAMLNLRGSICLGAIGERDARLQRELFDFLGGLGDALVAMGPFGPSSAGRAC